MTKKSEHLVKKEIIRPGTGITQKAQRKIKKGKWSLNMLGEGYDKSDPLNDLQYIGSVYKYSKKIAQLSPKEQARARDQSHISPRSTRILKKTDPELAKAYKGTNKFLRLKEKHPNDWWKR